MGGSELQTRSKSFNFIPCITVNTFVFEKPISKPIFISTQSDESQKETYFVEWDIFSKKCFSRIARYLSAEDISSCCKVSHRFADEFSQNSIWRRFVTRRMHYLITEEGQVKQLFLKSALHWNESFIIKELNPTSFYYNMQDMTFFHLHPTIIQPNSIYFNALKNKFSALQEEEMKSIERKCQKTQGTNLSPRRLRHLATRMKIPHEMISKSILFVLLDKHYNDSFFVRELKLKGVWNNINSLKKLFFLDRFLSHQIESSFRSKAIVKRLKQEKINFRQAQIFDPNLTLIDYIKLTSSKMI